VIKARIDIAILQQRLSIQRRSTKTQKQTLEIVEQRYRQGLAGPADVRAARQNLAAARAAEPVIELSLATAYHTLDVLLARRPGTSAPLPPMLQEPEKLEPVPVGLPAALLDRRPDIKAAEFNLRAINERLGAGIAQLFPDLTLTGIWGRSGDRWRDIWKKETEIYSAVTSLAQPVFKGGQLQAGIDAAKAQYEQAAQAYAATVLKALREVEDALVAEQMLQRQIGEAQTGLNEAIAAEKLSFERYKNGVGSVLTVLEAQQRITAAENQLVLLKGNLLTARVNLFLALGGDWYSDKQMAKRKESL